MKNAGECGAPPVRMPQCALPAWLATLSATLAHAKSPVPTPAPAARITPPTASAVWPATSLTAACLPIAGPTSPATQTQAAPYVRSGTFSRLMDLLRPASSVLGLPNVPGALLPPPQPVSAVRVASIWPTTSVPATLVLWAAQLVSMLAPVSPALQGTSPYCLPLQLLVRALLLQ